MISRTFPNVGVAPERSLSERAAEKFEWCEV